MVTRTDVLAASCVCNRDIALSLNPRVNYVVANFHLSLHPVTINFGGNISDLNAEFSNFVP